MHLLFATSTVGQSVSPVKDGTLSLVLSGLQMTVTNNIKNNQEQIIKGIQKAALEGASFLITPEGSLSGYTSNFNQSELSAALEK